jgi:hypothetical protein
LGGISGDPKHPALAGNGPAGGAPGDINGPFAAGGGFSTDRYLVPLGGGSGGGGTNDNGQVGAQGGAGGGALLIASSTLIRLDSTPAGGSVLGVPNGYIDAAGGYGGPRGCGGAGGAVRLVANTLVAANNGRVAVGASGGAACKTTPQSGLARLEANTFSNIGVDNVDSNLAITSLPFALNLPTAPAPGLMVTSINGIAINANPFSFPDTTINSATSVPVVITATNLPTNATVTLYLLSDAQPNQSIPVTMVGNLTSSSATVSVLFPSGATRGFVKATW